MSQSQGSGCSNLFGVIPEKSKQVKVEFTQEDAPSPLPFRIRDDFLSPAEASFYHTLKSIMKDYFVILSKVSLAEIFYVAHPEINYSARNRIDRKHVDFLICDPRTLSPQFGIELDDSSHQRADRQERDIFVDQVFHEAGLPILHIPVIPNGYNQQELGVLFSKAIKSRQGIPTENQTSPALQPTAAITNSSQQVPVCPKCGVPMVLREAKHGSNKGKSFYGCPNFPRCRQIVKVN
jgi:hypothetical protein